jgi:hypothetical protein
MPSDKAKANKALTATCVACNKPVSTESAVPLTCRLPAGSLSDRLTPRLDQQFLVWGPGVSEQVRALDFSRRIVGEVVWWAGRI